MVFILIPFKTYGWVTGRLSRARDGRDGVVAVRHRCNILVVASSIEGQGLKENVEQRQHIDKTVGVGCLGLAVRHRNE